MSGVVELWRARFWPRVAALVLLSIGVAACSGDLSRLNDGPFASSGSSDATGSIPQTQATPAAAVESAQPPAQEPSGKRIASASPLRPSTAVGAQAAGSPPPQPAKPGAAGKWMWNDGTAITVARGETLDSIARRHRVPASAIVEANHITAPATIHSGQRLVIPRFQQTPVAAAASSHPVAANPASTVAGSAGVHVVAAGETLSKISHHYGKPVNEIAKANNIEASAKLNVGDRLVIPSTRMSAVTPAPVALAETKSSAAPIDPEPPQSASMFAPTGTASPTKDAVSLAQGTGSLPTFRWPARGRVIAGYGPTINGQQNDGINLALPEGTPVKAAEDGVVAYAGNELKGYGNLILVRHPNGYVTAYAHAKELLVKRGEQVKRGQVIARSGQTGNVNAPQLHFEIRKGASPLDPMRFLAGA
jgi:murein DD-endopeptidase MepM/ murein hydrolase activator NlpD